MDLLYKIQLFSVAGIVGLTFCEVVEMILFRVPPSIFNIIFFAFSWVMMIKYNQAWHELWSKWIKR